MLLLLLTKPGFFDQPQLAAIPYSIISHTNPPLLYPAGPLEHMVCPYVFTLTNILTPFQSGVADYARHLHRVIPTLLENIPPGLTSKVPLLYTDAPDVHLYTLVGKGKQKGIRYAF